MNSNRNYISPDIQLELPAQSACLREKRRADGGGGWGEKKGGRRGTIGARREGGREGEDHKGAQLAVLSGETTMLVTRTTLSTGQSSRGLLVFYYGGYGNRDSGELQRGAAEEFREVYRTAEVYFLALYACP
ncbi:hypothetical protein KM043_006520 [Ampulex compressa]|nr:hypothetical protein KM043_006520 [Ampulex compressa]